jgi:hypothetical protein
MCDVGWMTLDEAERVRLRQYLLKGGFLWADDFWGDGEWRNFEYELARVFPDRSWRPIASDHPIMKIVFDVDACPQVPARSYAVPGGPTWDAPANHRQPLGSFEEVNFVGLFDDEDRLMAVATHNSDLGDGWEREAADEWFFENFSVYAYAMAINIITYAMTH